MAFLMETVAILVIAKQFVLTKNKCETTFSRKKFVEGKRRGKYHVDVRKRSRKWQLQRER
jgi:hypothetical protein